MSTPATVNLLSESGIDGLSSLPLTLCAQSASSQLNAAVSLSTAGQTASITRHDSQVLAQATNLKSSGCRGTVPDAPSDPIAAKLDLAAVASRSGPDLAGNKSYAMPPVQLAPNFSQSDRHR